MALSLSPTERDTLSNELNRLIDGALEVWNARQKPREYLGGSRLGVECLRALGYEWHNQVEAARVRKETQERGLSCFTPLSSFPGKVIRRFQMGHVHEDETAKWLQLAGFELLARDPATGEQFSFKTAIDENGRHRIAGHLDGIIMNGPADLPYPLLWEHKIMKSTKWTEFMRGGLETTNPVYWGQVHTYMGYMQLGHALFTSLNTDTSELGFELIPFDLPTAQRMSDRGVMVIESAKPEDLPRLGKTKADFTCKWCSHKERCWSEPEKPAAPPASDKPAWLSGWA